MIVNLKITLYFSQFLKKRRLEIQDLYPPAVICQHTTLIYQSSVAPVPSPLTDAFGCLEEAGVVCLLECVVSLSDEGG